MSRKSGAHIRSMKHTDANAVLSIYQTGIDTGQAAFAEKAPDWFNWDQDHVEPCRLVIELENSVVGWAALSTVSTREVYRGIAEISIYIDTNHSGKGFGKLLMQALIKSAEHAGFWTLQAGIFRENIGSMKLHQFCGFKQLGVRQRPGKMTFGPLKGQWRDVVLMEYRSQVTGRD